jgi:hypothetical protein
MAEFGWEAAQPLNLYLIGRTLMVNSGISLDEYFTYHPTVTDDRRRAHELINQMALEFAKAIDSAVQDPDCKQMAFFAVQQARMFANQGATIDELRAQQQSADG